MSPLRLLWAMARPSALAAVLLFGVLGGAAAGAPTAIHPLLTTVPLVLALWFVNAVAVNDLADEALDRVNLPGDHGRPLAVGAVDRRAVALVAAGAAVASVTLAGVLVGPAAACVVLAGLALSTAYSTALSGRGVLTAFLLPFGYVVVPYLVGVLAVTPAPELAALAPLPGVALAFLGRIVLKDLRDEHGDRAHGKRTFLVRHGRDATCTFSALAWVAGAGSVVVGAAGGTALVAPVGVLLAGVLVALGQLRTAGPDDYEPMVAAVALQGRALALVLLVHLTPGSPALLPLGVAVALSVAALRPVLVGHGAPATAA